MSGSLIAEMFTASHRGVANGVFSWGVYYGYGLAFVFGRSNNTAILGNDRTIRGVTLQVSTSRGLMWGAGGGVPPTCWLGCPGWS